MPSQPASPSSPSSRRGFLGLGALLVGSLTALGAAPAIASPFSDVPDSSQFAREITWMRTQGITEGYPDGTFRPLQPVARDAFAAFLHRLLGRPALTPPQVSPFRDVPTTSQFYPEITWARQQGLMTGWADGTFRPLAPIERCAAIAVFHRLAGRPAVGTYALYRDMPPGSRFIDEAGWARINGLMVGYADNTFRPTSPIARDAMAALFHRHVNGGIFGPGVSVGGAIGHVYWSLGGSFGGLGLPRENEHDVTSGASGRAGRGQTFAGGLIIWGPTSGAHAVRGAIRNDWQAAGGNGGPLGFPTSDEYTVPLGRRQDFEGGSRTWAPGWNPPAHLHGPVTAITPVSGGVHLRRGWNGTRVRIVQLKLGIHRTGSRQTYDLETENAVRAFQRRNGLNADGIVGPGTWARLAPEYPFTMDAWQTPVVCGPGTSRADRIEQMIAFAQRAIGSPYTWGGAGWVNHSVAGYDCSGLVLQAMYSAGLDPQPIDVVRHAEPTYRTSQMLYADPRLASLDLSQRSRGDLIFYADSGGTVRHVTLHLGNGQMIEAANDGTYGSNTHQRPYASSLFGGTNTVRPTIKRPFF